MQKKKTDLKIFKSYYYFFKKEIGITINEWMEDNDQDETTAAPENLTH